MNIFQIHTTIVSLHQYYNYSFAFFEVSAIERSYQIRNSILNYFSDITTNDGAIDTAKLADAIARISGGNIDNRKVHYIPLYPS